MTHLERLEFNGESKNRAIWRKVGRAQPRTQGKEVNPPEATGRTDLGFPLPCFTVLSLLLVHKTYISMVPRSFDPIHYHLQRGDMVAPVYTESQVRDDHSFCRLFFAPFVWGEGLVLSCLLLLVPNQCSLIMNFTDISINVHDIFESYTPSFADSCFPPTPLGSLSLSNYSPFHFHFCFLESWTNELY